MTNFLNVRTLGLILLLSSCAGDGTELDSTGVPLDPPEIEADRSMIELSLVEGTSNTSSFTITNIGGFPLRIDAVVAAETFLQPVFDGPVTVEKDQSREIHFQVDALAIEAAPYSGTIQVSSNADLLPNLSVSVLLTVTPAPEPEISVLSDTLRANVVEGLVDTVTFEILNSGTADLIISRLVPNVEQVAPLQQTLTIEPSGSALVPLQIDARLLTPGLFPAALEIHSNDKDEAILRVELEITVDFSGPFPATLSAIQTHVFDASCSFAGCHAEAFPPLNLHLSPGTSWGDLFEVPSFFLPEMLLVKPFDSANSFLITKLVDDDKRRIAARMPADLPALDDAVIDVIRRWIDEGALDN